MDPADLHILLVEDNVLNQKVLSKQLRKAGCTVHVANHGGEAIEFLPRTQLWNAGTRHGASDVKLNMILMDWEMPVMDGIACSKHIRDLESQGLIDGRVRIVGVTANAREAQIQTAIDAGMVCHTFNIHHGLSMIASLVLKSRVCRTMSLQNPSPYRNSLGELGVLWSRQRISSVLVASRAGGAEIFLRPLRSLFSCLLSYLETYLSTVPVTLQPCS